MAFAVAALAGLVYLGLVGADVRGWPRALKPVPALALAWATRDAGPLVAGAFVLSALGDALLLDKDRFLLAGLGAFLAAHLLFVAAFVGTTPPSALVGVGVLVAAGAVLRRVWPRLRGKMRVAVPVYAATLAAMAAAAGGLGPWGLAGGLLFVVSDGMLAVRLFRGPYRGGDVGVMATYYAALGALALAVS